jgi:hypothetical protein
MHDLSGARYFETFLGTGVCFNFWHFYAFPVPPLRRWYSGTTLVGPLQVIFLFFNRRRKYRIKLEIFGKTRVKRVFIA